MRHSMLATTQGKLLLCYAHQIETNAFGRNDSGTRVLYINLVSECTDSNKQKGADFFII